MKRIRVIPVLLLNSQGGFCKSIRFKNPKYVGDPINALRIFNEKEVDEVFILDIDATVKNTPIQFDLLREIAQECFMPLGYGGGIKGITEVERLLTLGIEKVSLNTAFFRNPDLIQQAADKFGSQAIVVSLDTRKNLWGTYKVYLKNGTEDSGMDLATAAKRAADLGAGEILLNCIDRDGTFTGYDLKAIKAVATSVQIPVIACGGARDLEDMRNAIIQSGASAVAAGSRFVFQGPHRAVLINYPSQEELKAGIYTRL